MRPLTLRAGSNLLLGLILSFGAALLLSRFTGTGRLAPFVAVPLLVLHHFRNRANSLWRTTFVAVAAASLFAFGASLLGEMRVNLDDPPEWDFHLFWLFGRASASGLDPYQQENLLSLAGSLQLDPAVAAELYFFHAPPTLFYFAPLGWFDIQTALLLWYVLHTIILLLVIVMLWAICLKPRDGLGLLLTAAMVFAAAPTRMDIEAAQLNYLMLLTFLLFWRWQKHPLGGLWMALSIFTKPIMAVLLLYALVRRRWQALVGAVVVMAVLSLLTMLVYGTEMFFGYFSSNPISNNMPDYLYNEIVNQSLLATILRVTNVDPSQSAPLTQPLYLLSAALLGGISVLLTYRLDERDEPWGLLLMLALALLIFPKTLHHYSFMLLAPVMYLWGRRDTLPGGLVAALVFAAVVYAGSSFQGGTLSFFAYAATWVVLAVTCGWRVMQPHEDAPRPRAVAGVP